MSGQTGPTAIFEPQENGRIPDLGDTLREILQLDGALAAAVVDARSGRSIRSGGKSAAIRLGTFVRGTAASLFALGSGGDAIESMVITLSTQYHFICSVGTGERIFLYAVFQRPATNLPLTARRLMQISEDSPGLRRIWHWAGVIPRPN